MQSKHLWYNIDINWEELDKKLQVLAPTGLNREEIWKHLFITKHRQNPFVEGRYSGADYEEVKQKWEATKLYFLDYKICSRPFSIDLAVAIRGFDIDNMAAQDAIDGSKALHARRWQTKDGTYRLKRHALPNMTSAMTLLPLAQTPFLNGRTGMTTTQWATNSARGGAGHSVLLHFLVEFNI